MAMHNGMLGHIGAGSADIKEDHKISEDKTLSDYINRKSKNDALASCKPKLNFEDWWGKNQNRFPYTFEATAIIIWREAQENS